MSNKTNSNGVVSITQLIQSISKW